MSVVQVIMSILCTRGCRHLKVVVNTGTLLWDVSSVVPVLSTGTKSNSSTSNFILVPVLELELEQ